MANAYFQSDSENIFVGSNNLGAQVVFEYAGNTIQLPVADGMNPTAVANEYISSLSTTPLMIHTEGNEWGNYEPPLPNSLQLVNPPSTDSSPSGDVELDKVSPTPGNDGAYYGSQPNLYGSSWTSDGVNTIEGYRPNSSIPILTDSRAANAVLSIPSLNVNVPGVEELPQLRLY